MSTFTAEPGTRLGGRYRLEDRVAAAGGWAAWKAIDETLARAVTVVTLASGFPRIREVLTAARAASRLSDARLAQVFDVEDDWDNAYIVMEWAVGETLGDMLAAGPVDPVAGARIVAEAASALSVAHAAGLAHLCLTPESLRWTSGGGVKVTGIGIDAALSGTSAEDPALADTRGLGRLLYASLTGLWPGADYPALPAAPFTDGHPRRPRQIRAGVPAALDDVTCQAMQIPGRSGAVLDTPGLMARALAAELPPEEVPPAGPETRGVPRVGREEADYWPGLHSGGATAGGPGGAERRPPSRRGTRAARRDSGSRARVAVVVVLMIVVVVGVAAATSPFWHKSSPPSASGHHHASHHHATATGKSVQVLTPSSAVGFDAYNLSDSGDENSNQAPNVLDGAKAGWSSQWYGSAKFGGLKPGTGLMLEMAEPVQLSSITVQFGNNPGADVEIKVGTSAMRSKQNLASMTTVASADNVGGSHTFTATTKATGQYIVIWFTQVPQVSAGKFMAQVYSVTVRGIARAG
jgi:hypothetical protein